MPSLSHWLATIAWLGLVHRSQACPPPEQFENLIDRDVNGSRNAIDRRWFSIGTGLWPSGQIIYCFDQTVTNPAAMEFALQGGWQLWLDAGSEALSFLTFRQGSQQECTTMNRAEYLGVSYAPGRLSTTVGRAPANPATGFPGPEMFFDPSANVGTASVFTNAAHEIGHAWGFLHEHQRPDLWGLIWPQGIGINDVFTFQCENLADWGTWSQQHPDTNLQRQCCEDSNLARENGFSAFNWLPYYVPGQLDYPNDRQPDRASIMLYESKIGGAPGKQVYAYANGDPIPQNFVPSQRDVEKLGDMYHKQLQGEITNLYFDQGSGYNLVFNLIRAGQVGSCSTGQRK